MADLLDELRDANPVVNCDPLAIETIWPFLNTRDATPPEPPAGPARARWRLPAALASALAAAAILVAILARSGETSIVARAYAAMDSNGVVIHWVSTSHATSPTGTSVRHEQAWISGPDAHTIITGTNPRPNDGRTPRLSYETALNGSLLRSYDASSNVISTARLVGSGTGPELPQNPLQTFRDFYNRGSVHPDGTRKIDGRRVNALIVRASAAQGRPTLTFFVDATTSTPVEFISYDYSPNNRLVDTLTTVFQTYTRLPLTTRTRALLALRPHTRAKETPTTSRHRGAAPLQQSP
jgi:hypothetical protein